MSQRACTIVTNKDTSDDSKKSNVDAPLVNAEKEEIKHKPKPSKSVNDNGTFDSNLSEKCEKPSMENDLNKNDEKSDNKDILIHNEKIDSTNSNLNVDISDLQKEKTLCSDGNSGKELNNPSNKLIGHNVTGNNRYSFTDEKSDSCVGSTSLLKEEMKPEKEEVGTPKITLRKPYQIKQRNTCNIICNRFTNHECSCHDGSLYIENYEKDLKNIKSTFSWLNFNINPVEELPSDDIMSQINEIARDDYDESDCFVLFLLSHGDEMEHILGIDCKPVKIEAIIERILKVKGLRDKPKLFFVQACRGNLDMEAFKKKEDCDDDDMVAANRVTKFKAQKSDIYVFYSTTKGNTSFVGDNGSFFIDTLCQVLQEYCAPGEHSLHLGDITTEVNYRLSTYGGNKDPQVSEVRHTLTENVCFYRPKESYMEYMNRTASSK